MAGGKRREVVDFGKKVGYFEARPLVINPSKDALSELLKFDMEKDPEYLKEDEDGNKKVILNIWVEDAKTKQKFNLKISVTNKVRLDKADVKTQYINRKGWTSWAVEESELPEWFTERGAGNWRKALVGEEQLGAFLGAWLHDLDFKNDSDASVLLSDMSKLFRGNCKELNDLVKDFGTNTLVALATINTRAGENGEEAKEFQSMYNKAFLPGNMMKALRIGGGNEYVKKQIKKFKETITEVEHGCKDFYLMGELQDYNPADNIAAGNATRVASEDEDDDDALDNATLNTNLAGAVADSEDEDLDTKW